MKSVYDAYNGPSDLPPIIFLHGLGDWRHTWRKVAPEIARRTKRHAYTPDARNHGDSPRVAGLEYDILTQDLLDFMDDHAIKTAVIVGHSMGGRTAINFALKHPEKTTALIIEDMSPRNIESGPESFTAHVVNMLNDFLKNIPARFHIGEGKRQLLDFVISLSGERFVDTERINEVFDIDLIPMKKTGDTFELLADKEEIVSMLKKNALVQNLPDSGLRYTGDALFLYGTQGFFNLRKDTSVKKLFPKAILRKIEGSSHFIHHDNPDVFVQAVSDFIISRDLPQSKY